MKKNLIFRAAGILLVLVLATTCIISGTFAKYTTGAEANATARAAKWGVTIDVAGDPVFTTEYKNTGDTITVKSSDTDNVVAPGTSGSAAFSISGTPEVRVKIVIDMDDNVEEIFLKAGSYKDYTTAADNDDFTLDDDYYPIKWTLTQTADATGALTEPDVIVPAGRLSDVNAALAAYSGAEYAPNVDLSSSFELSWVWPYETGTTDADKAINNKADTLLGNLAAGKDCYLDDGTTAVPAADYCLNTGYAITISAEQVD